MLIKCPECGREVSDKSQICIHCGYPLQQTTGSNICKINGVEYDLSEIYKRIIKHKQSGGINDIYNNSVYKAIFNDMFKLTHLKRSAYLCDMIYNDEKVPEIFSGETIEPPSKLRCPYCKSTNVKKIGTGGRLLSTATFGIAGSKMGKQWHCNNCKSDF